MVSVIIPVLNEEGINSTIQNIRECCSRDTEIEIIIVDGNSSGSTIDLISDRKVIKTISTPGRGTQMAKGLTFAKGNIILFLHADTKLPLHAFSIINNQLKSTGIRSCGAFSLKIDADGLGFRTWEWFANLRSKHLRLPFGDQALFITREYLDSVGGIHSIPILEDFDLISRIKKDGGIITTLKKRILVSARRWKREGLIYSALRNWFIITLFVFGYKAKKLSRFYPSED